MQSVHGQGDEIIGFFGAYLKCMFMFHIGKKLIFRISIP